MPDSGAAKSLNLCLAAKSLAGCHAVDGGVNPQQSGEI
jgi:hypothetical protein